jgi:hypothetical protein
MRLWYTQIKILKILSLLQINAQKMWPSTGSEILIAKVKMLDA